ncbi:serine/threonine protein phosphatase [Paenibacillus sp. ACRRX]|uniref:metallophosphoesterase family protein n=1 Tax=Paenibacillus sp. ACRRX TaxID=2918206 RepID=UPI001EF49F12|nr:metallophosphoesterase family protein [Paenibacillus sp. ACRRX]MCG7406158.1 serine/threonine protein phosphatase [Paenibacillus sp. ACRRX]
MKRTLVISDIHGELDKLNRLLELVNYDSELDQLILLGDYVDRGPDPRGVIKKVMELKAAGALALKGNHEDMMIKALTGAGNDAWNRWFKRNGGDKTLLSYGISQELLIEKPEQDTYELAPSERAVELLEDLAFLQELDHYIETEDYIFVHAGVHPTIPIYKTDPYTLMWIREDFHQGYEGQKTVVFGHTTTNGLHRDVDNHEIYYGTNRIIGIDGGAVYGGQLNALDVTNNKAYAVK